MSACTRLLPPTSRILRSRGRPTGASRVWDVAAASPTISLEKMTTMTFSLAQLINDRQPDQYDLHVKYISPHMARVQQIIGFDKICTRGEEAYLWDADGNRYLDLLAGYSVFNLGRDHPVVKQAMLEYLNLQRPRLVAHLRAHYEPIGTCSDEMSELMSQAQVRRVEATCRWVYNPVHGALKPPEGCARRQSMNVVLWALQIVLALKFISVAYTHAVRPDLTKMQRGIDRLGAAARPLLVLISLGSFVGAVSLILPALAGSLAWQAILSVLAKGGLLAGCSAGAMIMGEKFSVFQAGNLL